MKTHRPHTALFVFASWIVVGCGSTLQIGDPDPPPAETLPSAPTSATPPSPLPRPEPPAPGSPFMPCATGPLCWATTDATLNTLVSSWAVTPRTYGDDRDDRLVWAVTRHGEVVLWDGVTLTKKFQLAGTFDDALVWGTEPDNVYAFFFRAATQGTPAHTTVLRLHDGGWQVHASSGNYRIGALRSVDAVQSWGISAIISRADDPSSVALVDADLSPKVVLPRLPVVDESFDAAAMLDRTTGGLSVWTLTKTGRVFSWTTGSPAWTDVTPFPAVADATEVVRGTGIAPSPGYGAPGVRVVRDIFSTSRGDRLRRELATLGEGATVETRYAGGNTLLAIESILPHGRSVSYEFSQAGNDTPLVDAGRLCGGIGCGGGSNMTVDELGSGGTVSTVLPMEGRPLALGASQYTRHAVGAGGTVFTRPRHATPGGLESHWTKRAGGEGGIAAIDAVSDSDVWVFQAGMTHIGVPNSVRHYDGNAWTESVRAPDGEKMIASKEGVWIAKSSYEGSSLSLLKAGKWTSYPIGWVTKLFKDSTNGDLWAAVHDEILGLASFGPLHLYRWDGSSWARVRDAIGGDVAASVSVAGGVVWAGGRSIVRSEGGRSVEVVCPGSGLGSVAHYFVYAVGDGAWATSLSSSPDGQVWEHRLLRISANTCTDVTPPSWGDGLEWLNIGAGVRSSDVWITGTRWISRGGRRNVLFRWNGQKVEEQQLAFDPLFTAASVTPLGNLWVGAEYGAVLRSAVPKAE